MKTITTMLAFAFLAVLPATTTAQDICPEIDRYIAPLDSLGVFSGVVLAARGDDILCERAYGKASREFNIDMRTDHVFRIASISKPFTRALVGVLAERGKLQLSGHIKNWLPDFPKSDSITIQMLLDHRAGVPHVNSIPYDEESFEQNSLSSLVDSITKMPLAFAPGTRRSYSNGGYAVLARIIELIEKDSFARVLEREIIRPLGLTHTAHEADGDIVPRLATGYLPASDAFGAYRRAAYQQMDTKTGGGSMVSNAPDMRKFMASIGHAGIMSAATWRKLFPAADSVMEFTGRNPGYNSYAGRDARTGVVVVVLANSYAASMVGDIGQAVMNMAHQRAFAALPIRAPVSVPKSAIDRVIGFYKPQPGAVPAPPEVPLEIRRVGESVVAYIGDVALDVLVPQGDNRYLVRNFYSMVTLNESGNLTIRPLYRDAEFTAERIIR